MRFHIKNVDILLDPIRMKADRPHCEQNGILLRLFQLSKLMELKLTRALWLTLCRLSGFWSTRGFSFTDEFVNRPGLHRRATRPRKMISYGISYTVLSALLSINKDRGRIAGGRHLLKAFPVMAFVKISGFIRSRVLAGIPGLQ